MRTAQELGALVRDRRRSAGLTQQQLAERAHVTRQWLARLEKGHERAELDPLLRTLEQLDLELLAQPCVPSGLATAVALASPHAPVASPATS